MFTPSKTWLWLRVNLVKHFNWYLAHLCHNQGLKSVCKFLWGQMIMFHILKLFTWYVVDLFDLLMCIDFYSLRNYLDKY